MITLEEFKQSLERWSGFSIVMNENDTLEAWEELIQSLEDRLSNEIADRASRFLNQIREIKQ